jgi:class 3 adenylate cyclase/tetratricopeptide (TPR) repeat protein
MTLLTNYILIDRLLSIFRNENLPEKSEGAALFADISGFTPLTITLAQTFGPKRGAEVLIQELNKVFDALITETQNYQGSVISFAGDAITCWFDGDDGIRAIACGLAMQKAMEQFKEIVIGEAQTSLTLKVAIATGTVRRFLVGVPTIQYIDTLAGITLDRMAAGEKLTEKGEVIIDSKTYERHQEQVIILETRQTPQGEKFTVVTGLKESVAITPWQIPENIAEIVGEDQIKPWLLPPVYERIISGQEAYLAELRTIGTLFLRFGGLDYDSDPDAGSKLNQYISWAQNILLNVGGYLLQLNIGDKGSVIYAAFGAPISYDDNAVRAIAAALALRSTPPEFDFITSVQIGVSLGQMRCGAYGGKQRMTYGVIGDQTNIAARLMSAAAPGQILLSESIVEAASGRYEFVNLGRIKVKGKTEEIPIFTVSGDTIEPKTLLQISGEMIGRITERELLTQKLQILQNQAQGGTIIIQGEAGIGKSRLILELQTQAQQMGIGNLIGAGDSIEKATTYYAWRNIFKEFFQLKQFGSDLAAQRSHILGWLENHVPDLIQLSPLLNDVLALEFPENAITQYMSSEVRFENTRNLLVQLLQIGTSQLPKLLILEDAHWLDSASWGLTVAVSQRVSGLLLCIASRPLSEPVPIEYSQILQLANTQKIELGAMLPAEAIALVCQRLGVDVLPFPVIQLINEKAEGNPFFSEELAYALRDAGLIELVEGRCRLTPAAGDLSQLNFPDTVEGVITSRIDRLSLSQQLLIKVASVIGRMFAYKTLRDVHPVEQEKEKLLNYLHNLEGVDLTLQETPDPDLAYIFKHVITQEVAYNLMLFAQRQELHCRVAEWIENTYESDLSPYYPMLAYHWSKAVDEQAGIPQQIQTIAKAIDYLEKAGEQALRSYANSEAIAFFTKALEFDRLSISQKSRNSNSQNEQLRRGRWERQLGMAHFSLGNTPKARTSIESCLARLEQAIPNTPIGLATALMKLVPRQLKNRIAPKSIKSRPQEIAAEHALEMIRSYEILVELYFFAQELPKTTYAALAALNLAESLGESPELARCYAGMSQVAILPAAVRTFYQRLGREMAVKVNQLPTTGWVFFLTAIGDIGMGRWGAAKEVLTQAVDIHLRLGDLRRWESSLALLSIAIDKSATTQEDYLLSIQQFSQIIDSARSRGDSQQQILTSLNKAEILLKLNQISEAITILETVETLFGSTSDPFELIWAYGLQAIAQWRSGSTEAAMAACQRAIKLFSSTTPTIPFNVAGYTNVAIVCLQRWEQAIYHQEPTAELEFNARLACKAIKQHSQALPFSQPHAWRCQGLFQWLSGYSLLAYASWQKSLQAAERLQMPYQIGLAHYEIGRHLGRNDPKRSPTAERSSSLPAGGTPSHHLTRAAEIFSQLGAVYDLEQSILALT